jgi:hypothetical protein
MEWEKEEWGIEPVNKSGREDWGIGGAMEVERMKEKWERQRELGEEKGVREGGMN